MHLKVLKTRDRLISVRDAGHPITGHVQLLQGRQACLNHCNLRTIMRLTSNTLCMGACLHTDRRLAGCIPKQMSHCLMNPAEALHKHKQQ